MAKKGPTVKRTKASAPAAPAESPQPDKPKKIRAKSLKWDENQGWIEIAIEYLITNVTFRRKLFSDSTSDAQVEKRRKVQASEAKTILYGELAAVIFQNSAIDPAVKEEYTADPTRFAKSTQQQFARLKKIYQTYRRRFTATGGGLKEGEEAENLAMLINQEWPFYDDLHSLWSELPSYNPIGVTTSNAGQDFAGHAAALYGDSSGVSSGVEDMSFPGDDDDDMKSDENDSEHDSGVESEIELVKSTKKAISENQTRSDVKPQKSKDIKTKSYTNEKKDGKLKAARPDKRTSSNAFDDLHKTELQDAAARRAERTSIRLKELEVEVHRHELERERNQAKARKMELDAKRSDQMMDMMKMFMQQMQPTGSGSGDHHSSGMSFATSSSTGSSFFDGSSTGWDDHNSTMGMSEATQLQNSVPSEVVGPFTASLYSDDIDNNA